jgi:hypothetical protein
VEEIIPPSNPADPTRIAMILPLFYLQDTCSKSSVDPESVATAQKNHIKNQAWNVVELSKKV